jgi:segregation and condensation protein A
MLASLPDGARLEWFLPPVDVGDETSGRRDPRRRAAWAGTLLAGLELAREGNVALLQGSPFTPIHVRPGMVETAPSTFEAAPGTFTVAHEPSP